ncbi:MAG TPA: protein kinase [Gemmatimonadales bacterium]|jgi:serine/threonine-protein kinase
MTEALVARLTAALTGRYAIERELGQGGMATVYLARDLRHDRRVALKVLRPELAAVIGAERFLQEIRVTAGLQHPHILPLHDSGEIDHFLYYVMPYVEGESLRDRLARERQLAIEDALRIATEVLAALAYAHGRGVIHRDIKPENVLLASGAAVVADFGIARAVTAAGGGRLTETGLSLGTPQYMSPEQATADRELDGRSDVYALGAVLYEMLTGEPPHTGPTTQSVIAKLLTEEPRPLLAGRPAVPAHVAAAVHKALARLPADRFKGAAEFAEALARPGTVESVLPGQRPRRRQRFRLTVFGITLLAGGLLLGLLLRPAPDRPAPLVRSILKLPPAAAVSALGIGAQLAISPDASTIVYGGHQQLFVRRLDQLEPTPLAGTENASQPFFSPDGRQVGFAADGNLKRVPVAGGPVAVICPAPFLFGATWGLDDLIVFASGGKLFRVPASGGEPHPVSLADTTARGFVRWPEFLPDGKRVLVTAGLLPFLESAIVELETGRITPLPGIGNNARYLESSSLLSLGLDGSVLLTPFDLRRGKTTGPSTPVLQGVRMTIQGVGKAAVAPNGWIVYVPTVSTQRRLNLVDRRGVATQLATEPRRFSDPRYSPDGRSIVVTSLSPGGGLAGDIWVLSLGQLLLSRLTFDGRAQFPDWTADGRRVTFPSIAGSAGLLWAPIAGGEVDTLLPRPAGDLYEGFLTRDQQTIVYRLGGIPGDIYVVQRDSLGSPHALLASRFDERSAVLSPNERWLAYVSNETGRDEVYVRPFPARGGRWLVSAAGGAEPRWRRDGRELFYRNADSLFAVQIPLQPDFAVGRRSLLFTGNYQTNPRHAGYDVDPTGTHFIFVTGDPDAATELILVQNLVGSAVRTRPGRSP